MSHAGSTPGEGLTIAVVGASGAVGQDLLAVLPRAGLPIADVRMLAGPSSRDTTVAWGDSQRRVHVLPDAAASSPLFEGVDLAFFCCPADVTREHAPALAAAGVAVVDVGGALADRAPLVVVAAGTEHLLHDFPDVRIACSPSAGAVGLATLLAPLVPLGVSSCRGVVLYSAGLAGRAGVDELSAQVVALFNQQDPPRRVFPSGLAFDLLTRVGEGAAGWTEGELRLSAEVAQVVEVQPSRIAVTALAVPLFAGIVLAVHLGFEEGQSLSTVQAALAEAESIRLGDPVPGPRRTAGRAGLYVGRLREDPAGEGVHLLAVADNLRFGATANAVAIAQALWREGLL